MIKSYVDAMEYLKNIKIDTQAINAIEEYVSYIEKQLNETRKQLSYIMKKQIEKYQSK